jgi:hypothetical protein
VIVGNIDWIPIADIPDALRDGRQVLLWTEDEDKAVASYWLGYWAGMLQPSHFAEINAPEGQHAGV